MEKNSKRLVDPNVQFLYKAMRERDPRKRRVKPVQNNLVQVDFGGADDSEDDSDFDINKYGGDVGAEKDPDKGTAASSVSDEVSGEDLTEEESEGDDDKEDVLQSEDDVDISNNLPEELSVAESEEESDIDDSNDDDMEETDEDGNVSDDEDGIEDEDDESHSQEGKSIGHILSMIDSDEDDEDYVPTKKRKKKGSSQANKVAPKKETTKKMNPPDAKQESATVDDPEVLLEAVPHGRIKVIVCCVCLKDKSADDDEIVECDNCGIPVHEGCYGISESQSAASTESSASTEPWFCDACKAGVTPECELCPTTGGIFKETDNGRWVHLVCALYTPGVAFGDVDRLSLVTLFEMPYSRWGARECSLCEDSRFSQTGVCINCDAGMCKAYFHVTCAQRHGLLAEASPEEVLDIADPFFAYCKLHADKMLSKVKRRNYLAIQSQVKTHKPNVMVEEVEKMRVNRKLKRHREKYGLAKLKRPPTWLPTQKMVRHLHTSPSAVRGFLRKAELMGVITQSQTIPVDQQESRKKVQSQAQFTAEFINYFLERNVKVDNVKKNLSELKSQKAKLQAQEKDVRLQYEKLHEEVKKLEKEEDSLQKEGESLISLLNDILGKPLSNVPEVFKALKKNRTPTKSEATSSATTLINQCNACDKTTEQHLLAKCDQCNKHYHLGCLDPPLTRMPKKTKLFGWQCSFCAKSSSEGSVAVHPNVDQPRRLRETIKEPDKFYLSHIQDVSLNMRQRRNKMMSGKNKRRRLAAAKRVRTNKSSPSTSKTQSSPSTSKPPRPAKIKKKHLTPKLKQLQSPTPSVVPKSNNSSFSDVIRTEKSEGQSSKSEGQSSKSEGQSSSRTEKLGGQSSSAPIEIICVVCNNNGTPTDTVRCDECMLAYHLMCLDPPMKKSPKVRGYAWHCEACDMSEDSDDEPRSKQDRRKDVAAKRDTSHNMMYDYDLSSDDLNG